jgi:nucleotide-binding universal stress UspA family protein
MPLKDLLVIVDNTKAAARRIDYAAALADKHDAHLTGLYVKSPPQVPAYVEAAFPPDVRRLQHRMLDELADKAKHVFDEGMQRAGHGDRSEWRVAHGDAEIAAEILVRYSDLIIAGQTDPDEDDRLGTINPGDLVLGCGRPVLLVPYAYRLQHANERMLVAWDGSREAARAVADAMPLLERASHVTVLAVNPGPELGDEPCADITLHLARHNVQAEAAHVESHDLDTADALLSRAADLSVDLIVMGAYGRRRLRDLVMGSVTGHMLKHMTVPVVMSH